MWALTASSEHDFRRSFDSFLNMYIVLSAFGCHSSCSMYLLVLYLQWVQAFVNGSLFSDCNTEEQPSHLQGARAKRPSARGCIEGLLDQETKLC